MRDKEGLRKEVLRKEGKGGEESWGWEWLADSRGQDWKRGNKKREALCLPFWCFLALS